MSDKQEASLPCSNYVTRKLICGPEGSFIDRLKKQFGVEIAAKISTTPVIHVRGSKTNTAAVTKVIEILQLLDQKASVLENQHNILNSKGVTKEHWEYLRVDLNALLENKTGQVAKVAPAIANDYAVATVAPEELKKTTPKEVKTKVPKRASVQFLGDFEARNLRQAIVYEACTDTHTGPDGQKILSNSFVYAAGPAGGGKTFSPLRAGLELYAQGVVGEVLIIRPDTSVSKNKHAALPGKARDKIQPFVKGGIESNIPKIVKATLQDLEKNHVVKVLTPADERGETYDNAFVLVDEAQNLSVEQAKLLVGRIGEGSIMVFTGDIGGEQNDLSLQLPGLVHLIATQGQGAMADKVLDRHMAFAQFTEEDSAARNGILPHVLRALNNPPEEYSKIMETIAGLKPNSALSEAIEKAREYGVLTLSDRANATFSRYEARLKGNYPQFFVQERSKVTQLHPSKKGPAAIPA